MQLGMAGALETLCGQTYGAEEYHKLGDYTWCAIISLTLVCVPISLLWTYMDRLLILFGQDPLISQVAGQYSTCLIPALFGYAVLQSLVRFFQSQKLILPMLITSCSVLCLHIPLCWILVFKLELGISGAAFSIGASYWLNVVFLGLYMNYSSACEKTRIKFSKEAFRHIREFISLAIPSALMLCLEYASFELLVFLSGFFPNAKLEASVLSICITTTTSIFYIPYGIGAAASTQVSNRLGAGNAEAVKLAIRVALVLGVAEAVVGSTILFCSRNVLGYAYSNEKEVVDYVTEMVPLLSFSIGVDSLVAVLSGVARGSGWQDIGAYVNLGAYYVVGIPLAALLGFVFKLRGKGLWIGIMTGTTLQAVFFLVITIFTNWQKQAEKAKERIFREKETLINHSVAEFYLDEQKVLIC
ncbi:protein DETOXIFICATION 14-like isoform X2 [Humulus lupulus]|uniref:protein DETOXIFICATION 14-like isoform X2 n=1 Tax=Humulus lupulus TaxID=3486 RepID=UPI002B41839E|nr:protein DETOXIFICATION 14-like isoform X2 [Humulus lupulus]